MSEFYRVELSATGQPECQCANCQLWTITYNDPEPIEIGTSWDGEIGKETAEDVCDYMNMAYAAGRESTKSQRDELLAALKAIVYEGWSYESEYDGQMFEHCKGCSYQTPHGKGEHTSDCPYIKAEALIARLTSTEQRLPQS